MASAMATLLENICAHPARIGIIGPGYVGFPLVLRFGAQGFSVIGFDVDPSKATILNRGKSSIPHIAAVRVHSLVSKKQIEATGDFKRLSEVDCIISCVATPLTAKKDPDLQYFENADAITKTLRIGQIILLESPTYPATTDEILLEKFRPIGLVVGKDCFLVFSPEREDPGNPKFSTRTIPKVVEEPRQIVWRFG